MILSTNFVRVTSMSFAHYDLLLDVIQHQHDRSQAARLPADREA